MWDRRANIHLSREYKCACINACIWLSVNSDCRVTDCVCVINGEFYTRGYTLRDSKAPFIIILGATAQVSWLALRREKCALRNRSILYLSRIKCCSIALVLPRAVIVWWRTFDARVNPSRLCSRKHRRVRHGVCTSKFVWPNGQGPLISIVESEFPGNVIPGTPNHIHCATTPLPVNDRK